MILKHLAVNLPNKVFQKIKKVIFSIEQLLIAP